VEGGGGKGVHFGVKCFFHCGGAREGFSEGNFFYNVIMRRGVFRVHLDFFFLFFTIEGWRAFF